MAVALFVLFVFFLVLLFERSDAHRHKRKVDLLGILGSAVVFSGMAAALLWEVWRHRPH